MESKDKVPEQENGEAEGSTDSMDETAAEAITNEESEGQRSESEEEGEDGEEGNEENPKLALLDQPLLQTGRRKKHSVQRLQMMSPDREKKKLEFVQGEGIPVGEIEAIEQIFQRTKGEELKIIHRLAFGRAGASHEVKRNLRQFSGFAFDKSNEQYERKRASLAKYPTEIIRETCEQLCLSRSGKKDDLVDRVMEFLLKPTKAAATGGRRANPSKPKRKRSSTGSTSKSPRKRTKSSATADSEDDKDESPKKKKKHPSPVKKGEKTPTKAKTVSLTGSAKRKQATPKKTFKVATVASDSDSSDDEPLSRKFSSFPSDAELQDACKSLLAKADLQSVTVKSICLKVYEKYAEHDLSDKKDFLKKTIKELYENMV